MRDFKANLKKHIDKNHSKMLCGKKEISETNLQKHAENKHKGKEGPEPVKLLSVSFIPILGLEMLERFLREFYERER